MDALDHKQDSDLAAQLEAARSGAVITVRSDRGKLAFSGEDRATFLHGMLTNTVEGIQEGEGNHAALTDARGSTQADMWVYHWGDRLMMETEPGLQRVVSEFLDRYIIADDVAITDETDRWSILGIQGGTARQVVEKAAEVELDLAPYAHCEATIANIDVRITSRSYVGSDGFDVWVERADATRVNDALLESGCTLAAAETIEALRIEAGIPRYGMDVDERVAPLEGGMADTVDFTKGCFIGQEVLAKMNNIGQPRRYLVGIVPDSEDVPPPETELSVDGKVVGLVKSGVRSDRLNKVVCLASVRRGFEAPGTSLEGPQGLSCVVVPLPFSE